MSTIHSVMPDAALPSPVTATAEQRTQYHDLGYCKADLITPERATGVWKSILAHGLEYRYPSSGARIFDVPDTLTDETPAEVRDLRSLLDGPMRELAVDLSRDAPWPVAGQNTGVDQLIIGRAGYTLRHHPDGGGEAVLGLALRDCGPETSGRLQVYPTSHKHFYDLHARALRGLPSPLAPRVDPNYKVDVELKAGQVVCFARGLEHGVVNPKSATELRPILYGRYH